jgi:glycosyltransferase involved in cell wall biosynthesis
MTDRSGSAAPGVSVVVPVRNAAATVERCIDSVLGQTHPASRIEAIFVDNGSKDASRDVLERRGAEIRVLSEPKRGAAAARNAGIRAARHPYVAFTDADCVAGPDWVEQLVDCALANPEVDFVGGRFEALDPTTTVERFEVTLHDQQRAIEVHPPPSVAAGNFLAVRDRLLEIGLFDETYLRGEDSELCYRAGLRHGCRFAYAEKAVVHHANRKTLRALAAMGFAHGKASAHVWQRYAGELGLSRAKRCTSLRSYTEPLRSLRAGGQPAADGGAADTARRIARCDAAFRFAKEIGFLVGTIRYR